MRTIRFSRIAAATVVFSLAATVAMRADSRIEFKVTEGKGSTLEAIMIGQGKIRTDADKTSSVVMDPTAGTITMIDHAKKTFTRMTKADIDSMAAQLDGMMKQMEQAMANMPPEMKEMMKGRMGAMGSAPAIETVDTGKSGTAAGKPCRIIQTKSMGKVVTESCMGDASAIDVPAADRATLVAAMGFFKDLADKLSKGPLGRIGSATPFQGGGVPLRSTTFAADGSRNTSEFSGVVTTTIPAEVFAVPAGYREQKMEMPGRGRGGRQ
ncbi:MAG TPA: hypothetical protein VN700_13175 [Vicinamibacterales bacterium]|nr:hypothetical protein [Vicinamibacterales bacterium]